MRRSEKFFNAGTALSEVFMYSLPDGHDVHCVGRYVVDAPEAEFFEVPTELEVGAATVHTRFGPDLLRRHGPRGVILLDRNREKIPDEEPVAATEAEAKRKGAERWQAYLREIVDAYLSDVELAVNAQRVPRRPAGFTKYAMKRLGVVEPREEMFAKAAKVAEANAAGETPKLAELERRLADRDRDVAELKAMVSQLVAGQAKRDKGADKAGA